MPSPNQILLKSFSLFTWTDEVAGFDEVWLSEESFLRGFAIASDLVVTGLHKKKVNNDNYSNDISSNMKSKNLQYHFFIRSIELISFK